MSGAWVLDYKGGAKGCPPFVSGTISAFVESEWDDDDESSLTVYRTEAPLELIAKHPLLCFDYAKVHSLFIASETLVEAFDGLAVDITARPLRVFAGKKEMTQKRFFALRVNDRRFAMDEERSEYQVMRAPDGKVRAHWADATKRQYKNIHRLVVDERAAAGTDLFWCYEAVRHIASERLAERLRTLAGVAVTRADEYVFPLLGEKVLDRG